MPRMRILVAPDKFAGTLTAVEAADAIAAGWRRHAPDDELDLAPMSDGGPGFVDVLHAALGGELLAVTVTGPFGQPVPAAVLVAGDTAYVESAQACGIHLTNAEHAERATTLRRGRAGGGRAGDRRADGGGRAGRQRHQRRRRRAAGRPGSDLRRPAGRGGGRPGRHPPGGPGGGPGPVGEVRLVAASDVDNPLTGLFGATKVFGPQKGLPEELMATVDGWLEQLAVAVDRRTSLEKGAGAAGGLGFALLALGATREPGIGLVADAVRLAERSRAADLVVTGEGAFDFSSRAGKVPYGVASVAGEALRPCVAVAGQVLVGAREMRALGVESAYSLVEIVGEERALGAPAEALADVAERVARTWSPRTGL